MGRANALNRALDLLSRKRKALQKDYSEIYKRQSYLNDEINRLESYKDRLRKSDTTDSQVFDATQYLLARTAEQRLSVQIDKIQERLEIMTSEVCDPLRERLIAATQREKTLENLIQKRELNMKKKRLSKDQSNMDDAANIRWKQSK